MTARAELAALIAHPTGVSAGLTIPDVADTARDMAINIRSVTEQEAADMLATMAGLLDEVAAIVRADRCSLRTINGHPCAVHFDCDDYPDGTVTSILTGQLVES